MTAHRIIEASLRTLAIGALAATLACDEGEETADDTAPTPTSVAEETGEESSAEEATAGEPLDACALYPAEAAAAILGEPVGQGDPGVSNPGGATTATFSSCSYAAEGSSRTLSVFARRSPVDDNTEEAIGRTRSTVAEMGSGEVHDVEGMGEAAFWVEDSMDDELKLHVFDEGNLYVIAGIGGYDDRDEALSRARTLVGEVLAEL